MNERAIRHGTRPGSLLVRAGLWVPPAVYMVVIFLLSSASDPLPQLTAVVWDKLLHTTEYAGLAFLLCRALVGEGIGWFVGVIVAVVLTVTYGASDEWHQAFVAGRDSSVFDWFADTVGGTLGASIFALVSAGRNALVSHSQRRSARPMR
jgi:VanZ family protein